MAMEKAFAETGSSKRTEYIKLATEKHRNDCFPILGILMLFFETDSNFNRQPQSWRRNLPSNPLGADSSQRDEIFLEMAPSIHPSIFPSSSRPCVQLSARRCLPFSNLILLDLPARSDDGRALGEL